MRWARLCNVYVENLLWWSKILLKIVSFDLSLFKISVIILSKLVFFIWHMLGWNGHSGVSFSFTGTASLDVKGVVAIVTRLLNLMPCNSGVKCVLFSFNTLIIYPQRSVGGAWRAGYVVEGLWPILEVERLNRRQNLTLHSLIRLCW